MGVPLVPALKMFMPKPISVSARFAVCPKDRTEWVVTFQSAFRLRELRVRLRGDTEEFMLQQEGVGSGRVAGVGAGAGVVPKS